MKPDYCNEQIFERNRLPPRSYYIPDTAISLNGVWDFNYAPTPLHAPEPHTRGTISADGFSTPDSNWKELNDTSATWSPINVPGHWQLQGYGRPQYTNTVFPFPVCPPDVPTENPTGTYRRSFYVPEKWDKSMQLRLRFDGVDSAYNVWVNGIEVGYSQGSRNAAEFDISQYVEREASNELFVRVYQWSDGSYIEDQDQWWLSGIFRDVTLIAFPGESRIEDFFVKTDLNESYKNATLNVSFDLLKPKGYDLYLTLKDPSGANQVVATQKHHFQNDDSELELQLEVSAPSLWTAESPYLYELEISFQQTSKSTPQIITQRVGFRKVELKRGNIAVNGVPILLRGVNRHDHHPLLGRAVPLSYIKEDLMLMKKHNVNALRCSHYPSHPELYDLCDELGLWVMDEADLECHGFYDAVARPLDIPESMDYEERKAFTFAKAAKFTSDNEAWKSAYLDRMAQVVQRDKNHPSVIIWSLGNEAFYGQNHKAMYEYAKRVDPGRLVHYEGDTNAASADMFSYMYPSVGKLLKSASTVRGDLDNFEKPIVLCEYGHAMGNGPGELQKYQEAFYNTRRLQGGFIWEWANHGLWKDEGDGQAFYAYGGDFGDVPNDGTFVMDGLCFSDHTPTPGLIEYKKVIEPVTLSYRKETGEVALTNRYDYIDLKHLTATYKVEKLGRKHNTIVKSGELAIPEIPAGEIKSIELPKMSLNGGDPDELWVTITLRLKASTLWADAGHEIAWTQFQLEQSKSSSTKNALLSFSTPLQIHSSKVQHSISSNGFSFAFDRARGYLIQWTSNGYSIGNANALPGFVLSPSFWRPPTDNDMSYQLAYWQRYGLDSMTSQLRCLETSSSEGSETVRTQTYISAPILAWGYEATITYVVSGDGSLTVTAHLKPVGPKPDTVPRVGLDLRLNKALDTTSWFGLGPGESYPDKSTSQRHGHWSNTVDKLMTAYEVPQENGNRMQTRWLEIADISGSGVRATMTRGGKAARFNWQVGRYSPETVLRAKHPCDLVGKEEEALLLRIDAEVAGLGSAACGPGVSEEYQVKCEEIEFEVRLEPIRR